MSFRLRVSDEEREAGKLAPEQLAAAMQILVEHGCIVLENLYPLSLVEWARAGYAQLYGAATAQELSAYALRPGYNHILEVGAGRFDIVIKLQPPFDEPDLFWNPVIADLCHHALGDHVMATFTTVVSYPGAEDQHVHRDHAHLYGRSPVSTGIPPFAFNLSVPLVDVDLEIGPTAVWPGSHREHEVLAEGEVPVPMSCGDCLLIDYRLVHRGLANRSERVRPVLYMVYARSWFVDERNHIRRNPLDAPWDLYRKSTPEVQYLLKRAWMERMRAEQRGCPCGSETPFNLCHGAR